MSTPTTRPGNGAAVPPGVTDDVPSYVAAVRGRLDDLSPDEVEELTGGLEADLAEALAGFDETPRERFGDPAAYADELRAAADLPPRREPRPPSGPTLTDLRGQLVATFDDQLEQWRRLPWFPPVRDFVVVLRPAWWVLRAWVAVAALRQMFLGDFGIVGDFGSLVLLLLAIVASVTIGRRSPLPGDAASTALMLGNLLAVIALPFVVANASSPPTMTVETQVVPPSDGLWMDGAEVTNILPYDSQGRPLTGVQLFDSQGQPLRVSDMHGWDGSGEAPRGPANVFPRPQDPADTVQPDVPALEPTPDESAAPTALPSAGPTASAAPPTPSAAAEAPTEEPTARPTPAGSVTPDP
jgi:hypothetical protein